MSTPGDFNATYTPRSAPVPGSPAESAEYGRFFLRGLGSPGIGEVGGGSPRPSCSSSSMTQARLEEKIRVKMDCPKTAYRTSASEYGRESPLSSEVLQKADRVGKVLFARPAGRSTDSEYLGVYGRSAIACNIQRSRAPCIV